ncbi:MAG: porin [Verrucomicrobiota bacterium]
MKTLGLSYYLRNSLLALGSCALATAAYGGTTVTDQKETEAPEPRFKIYGWVEGGFAGNFESPRDNQNFGRLFDDRANEPLLNQAVITLERTLDPKATGFDWGFKVQGLFGSDARFIHSLGIFDDTMKSSLYQPDLVEAYLNFHFPVLTEGGIDMKLGKFVTLEGAETIDPRTNVFYSHSYIFNFGIPFNHTGALATIHANKTVDLMFGITRGVNTSVDDNNSSMAFHGGFGLTFCDGKLVILGSAHIGPETPHDNTHWRYLSDITATWKITDKLTAITDLNYIHDDLADADGGGGAQYLTYAINDWLTAGIRAEIWRDAAGFYVTQFADPHDPMRGLRGEPFVDPRTVGGGRTTYGELTVGLTFRPNVPKPLTGLMIRPEFRCDRSLNNTHPFNDSSDRTMLTAGVDVIFVW